MQNTNLSEEAIKLEQLGIEIYQLQEQLRWLEQEVTIKQSKLYQLIERKKSLLNYLNTDNN